MHFPNARRVALLAHRKRFAPHWCAALFVALLGQSCTPASPASDSNTTIPTTASTSTGSSAPSTSASTSGDFGREPAGSPPATLPAAGSIKMTTFDDAKAGIKLDVPDWKKVATNDYVLMVKDGSSTFSLDVPDLPAHPPGFIPLGLVKNGFIDDLKKSRPDLKILEDADLKIPSANARRLRLEWSDKDVAMSATDVLIVHDDHVYILRLESDKEQADTDTTVIGDVVKSISWEKAQK